MIFPFFNFEEKHKNKRTKALDYKCKYYTILGHGANICTLKQDFLLYSHEYTRKHLKKTALKNSLISFK